jgi:hypothetical protein
VRVACCVQAVMAIVTRRPFETPMKTLDGL